MLRRRDLLLAAAAASRKPNVILILADDLGVGDLGCYGQKLVPTPNIDRLAKEGLRFTAAYAGAMVCAPARCALMTGYHMGHATVRNNWEVYPEGQHPLAERDTTVAQVLKQAGYRTGICGKWDSAGRNRPARPRRRASTSSMATTASATRIASSRLTCGRTTSGCRWRNRATNGSTRRT